MLLLGLPGVKKRCMILEVGSDLTMLHDTNTSRQAASIRWLQLGQLQEGTSSEAAASPEYGRGRRC